MRASPFDQLPRLPEHENEAPISPTRIRPTRRWTPLVMKAPSVVVLGLVVLVPVAYSLQLSLTSYSPVIAGRTGQWVGLENYQRIIQDTQFFRAIVTTFIFVVVSVAVETLLGTALGMGLNRLRRLRRTVTSVLLVPMILTPLVIGLMFNFALNPQFGYLQWVLNRLGLPISDGMLSSGPTALAALIAVDIWEWVPFIALMVLAGLSALPTAPFEAASIDGASTWQTHRYVTLPMLRPILGIAVLFRATEAFREFDKVFVLTGGGPGDATIVNDLYQYRVSFVNWDLSYGAALGLVSFAAVVAMSAVMYRLVSRREVQL